VEIALAKTKEGKKILVAGINSGSDSFTTAQLAKLKEWGVNVAPETLKGAMKDLGAPHAEANISAFLQSIGARGLRWSKAVVGEWKPNGVNSYVCPDCKSIIRSAGGTIEPGI
jgi:hypothetical protein